MTPILVLLSIPLISLGQAKIKYKVFFQEDMENEGLRIQVDFTSKKVSDSTYFHYSNQVWGENNLTYCLKLLQKENPGYTFKIESDINRIVVYHPKSNDIRFSYHIIQDFEYENPKPRNRPLLQQTYFHILGESLFTIPEEIIEEDINDPKIVVSIEWLNFPKDYLIHNTFGTNRLEQTFKVKLWSQFYHSIFIGGDYRIKSFEYLEKPIHLAIRGKWLGKYTDSTLFGALKRTISTQRGFWKDNGFDYYTVVVTPTVTQTDSLYRRQNITGSRIHNGFLIQSSNNPFNHLPTLKYMFNHEMMHDWIGGRISMQNEELNYWFSEGFTEYYTYKNGLRSGSMSLKEFLQEFNTEVIKAHWENPERNQPNYVVKDNFWNSKNVEKIPYRRGAIFAFWLDNQILKKSNHTKSLDDLMRDILNICVEQNKKFTDDLFLQIAAKYLERDITYFFQKHIISGEDIQLKKEDLIQGFEIEHLEGTPKVHINEDDINNYLSN